MYLKAKMTRVKKPSDVPPEHHYAIILYNTTSVHHEGDERSRTNPGHGYPAHTETFDTFEHYVTIFKDEWLAAIAEFVNHADAKGKFICFEVNKLAKVSTKVVVDIA